MPELDGHRRSSRCRFNRPIKRGSRPPWSGCLRSGAIGNQDTYERVPMSTDPSPTIDGEPLLSSIMQVIPYVVFWKDRDSAYLGCNENFARLAGLASPAEIVGLTDFDLPWSREEAELYRADDREVMESETPKLQIIESQVNATGDMTWLETNKVPLRGQDGNVTGVLGAFTDITERKNSEENLQRTRQHLEDAIQAIDSGLVMYDADEKLVFCNDSYKKIYWQIADRLAPGSVYEELLREYFERLAISSNERVKEGWVRERIEQHRRCERRWEQQLGERVILVSDQKTRDGGTVSLRTDITAERERQDEFRRAKEAAIAANEAKSAFLANMSHEIRTPMTAILGFTDVLLSTNPHPEQLESLTTIQRNAEHLLDLINDILDLSRIAAGKVEVNVESTSLADLLDGVVSLMAVRARDRGLTLTTEFVGPIPKTIRTDVGRARQILVNLVGNAVKFTRAGSVKLIAREAASCSETSGQVEIVVVDTGIGIAPDHLERIFGTFEQADPSTTREFGGSGLGLAISQRLASLLGGWITARSELGDGSEFTLTLPVGEEVERVSTAPRSEASELPCPADELTSLSLEGSTVLLVEDGPDNQRLFSHYLRSAGASVQIANHGEEALEREQEARSVGQALDLILMDMQMPVLDGYSAARRLRQTGCKTPIIALTAHAMSGDRDLCLEAGCDGYLTKPVTRRDLISTVARWTADPE